MARETRFGLFLAAMMLLSAAVATADPGIRSSAEPSPTRGRATYASGVTYRASGPEREAREDRPLPSGLFSGPPIGTQVGHDAPKGRKSDPVCRRCIQR